MCAWLKQNFQLTPKSLYPPNSVHQICCGLSRALKSANWVDINMFNSPKFTQFRDIMLVSIIKTFFGIVIAILY